MHKTTTDWKKRPHQKDTRKLNDTCISRIYVDYYNDGHVTVTHITAHTNHQPGHHEDMYLPLPKSIKDEIAIKLSNGISAERIMEGTCQLVCTYTYIILFICMYAILYIHVGITPPS